MKGIRIINRAEKQSAEILIYEDVGAGFWSEGITAHGFLKELRALGKIDQLDVRINSNGGSVFDGIAIYNALRQHPARKTVHVDGIAASIASVIAMAGDEIRMGEGAWMMIHDPSGLAIGSADEMRATADLLDQIKGQLIGIYATRTGMADEAIAALMEAETWMDAEAAIANKFADIMSEPVKMAATVAPNRFFHLPESLMNRSTPTSPAQVPGPAEQQAPSLMKGTVMPTTMKNLQDRAAEHQAAAMGIQERINAEARAASATELAAMEAHLQEVESAKAEMDVLNRLEAADQWLNRSGTGRKTEPVAPADGLMNTRLPTAGERGRWGFENLGTFAKSVRSAVTGSGVDPRLVQNASLSTYGNEETGADGGFAVPPDFRAEIQSLVMGEASMLAQCDSMPTASNRVTFPTDESTAWQTSGGVLTYWGSEAGSMTQSKPVLKEVGVTLNKLYAFVPVTDEMLEDAPMMSRYLAGKAGEKLDFAITDAIVNGNGAGKPLGLMSAACKVAVAKEGSQAADTVVANNILKMYARQLNPGRAVWLVNADTLSQLLTLNLEFKSSAGAGIAAGTRMPTITFPGENGSTFASIMGRPVIVTEACGTVGDEGDIIFADLAGGYFAPYKAGGIRNDVSMHLWFDQGVTAFRWTMRVGGQPWLSAAVSSKNSAATRSSIVTCAVR